MKQTKRAALEAAGFRVGTAQEFLGLSDWENQLVELKYKLRGGAKRLREARALTQQDAARLIHSSQSRVAKIEAGAGDVSLDLLFRYWFALGGDLGSLAPKRGDRSLTNGSKKSVRAHSQHSAARRG